MKSAALVFTLLSALMPLAAAETLCNSTLQCPESAPCCSPYGYCNTAKSQYCLGGCQPFYSFKPTSCKPTPVCESTTTHFNDLSRVLLNGTTYKGNASAYDWIVDSGSLEADPNGNGARLILTQEKGGTKISSTRYVHYGQIDFEMQTSKWAGVVSAAITMSDVKDEIDWEWPGAVTDEVQSNYFFLGIANYSATDGAKHGGLSDTSSNFHVYTLNWQEDKLQWIIDGKVVRTLNKEDTLAKDGSGQYKYPSTPSRVQISIWPAGIEDSGQGTVDWAGGMIDWSNADYAANGYFYNTVKSVSIQCADSSAAADSGVIGITGYQYSGNDNTNVPVIEFTNRSTILGYNGGMPSAGRVSFAGVLAAIAVPSLLMLF